MAMEMLIFLRVQLWTTEDAGAVDRPFPAGHRGTFSCLVDVAGLRSLDQQTLKGAGVPGRPESATGGNRAKPGAVPPMPEGEACGGRKWLVSGTGPAGS